MSNGGSYNPHAIEGEIYRFWEAGGYFRAVPNPDKRPFIIDIPLPNVTGALHLGHALNNTLQDVLIRVARMRGYEALWMPGLDHAGIATQAVVERRLKQEQNLTRHDLGREGLVERIWAWKAEYGERILGQLRRMGFSCDWTRTRFTLDEICARAVYEVFFEWFKAGLIYRGERLVNWDAFLQTAVADDEIVHETVKGHLWHVRYPIEGNVERGILHAASQTAAGVAASVGIMPGRDSAAATPVDHLVVATTRPETMLGDTAVAVHPADPRYQHLIGRRVMLPLVNRPIPIIADPILVKMEFGTGCVKVTPAHDPNDYECAKRHSLPMINILTPDGKINANGGRYAGMDRYEARKKVVADLEQLGLLERIEPYETEVGHSDRSKTPIEPMLSEQWFVKMGELAELAMEAVRDGRVRFFPQRYEQMYLDWLGEKRDWCISRQLWWGHRIPVWTKECATREAQETIRLLQGALGVRWQVDAFVRSENISNDRIRFVICLRYPEVPAVDDGLLSAALTNMGFQQDPDVLDTWFSSSLWPFSTLGWPHRERSSDQERAETSETAPSAPGLLGPSTPTARDLAYFYPTSTLVTGRGIITLWVARMVMTGLYFLKRVPFQHVHIHPIIQDGQGRTMSKSLGNGVDPLDIIELYGTDALRFVMAQMDTETQDVRMPVKPVKLPDGREVNSSDKFEIGRNFCNKIWQAATGFVLPNMDGYAPRPLAPADLALEDHWILSRLGATIAEVDHKLDRYQISDVAGLLYSFFWNDYCDWYLELVKPRLGGRRPARERDTGGEPAIDAPAGGHAEGAGGAAREAETPEAQSSRQTARQVLVTVLDQALRLLHPLVPFITESLWSKLNAAAPQRGISTLWTGEPALIRAKWPDATRFMRAPQVEREITALQAIIRSLRDLLARINASRSAGKQPAIGKLPRAVLRVDEMLAPRLREQHAVLERLGRCDVLEIGSDVTKPGESATAVLSGVEVYVPLAGLMDLAAERGRLASQRDELRGHIERLEAKLANEGFAAKAPPAVVAQEQARLADLRERLTLLERNLAELSSVP